ncbi:MAG TPA: Hsp70 family protein [Verrucomicrobiae bacterium]|nr:Hsp70 family protein [Verrucomicrobiae bacterium]
MDEGESARYERARICIDFGTALSKASICLDPMLPLEVGVKPLPIGAIARGEHPLLTPSVIYVDGGRLFFGPAALDHARRGVEGQRDPLLSFKTVLGATNVDQALAQKLRPSMDPTGTFINRDALVLYLAYLDQLIREAIELAPNIPNAVVNAKRRYTSPVWKPGSGTDKTFEAIFNEAAAVSQRLGKLFHAQEGISIAQCKDALDKARLQPGNGLLETGIFEPHAAAATALAFTSAPTRFVLVFDMGAGTVDFAAFDFDESTEPPALTEIKEARQCSALAGDEIDRILIELYLRKRGGEKSREDELRLLRTARLSARDMKKELFTTGKTSLKTTGWMATTIRINELMEDQNFRTYLTALRNTMAASLNVVLQRAEAVGANAVDVVLAGGGSNLPFMPDLVKSAAQVRPHNIQVRFGPLSPTNPLYNSVDPSLRDVFPQIAMSVGGALVEMMPAR